MFYFHEWLCKRYNGRFSIIWLAATNPKKLKPRDYLAVSVARACEEVQNVILLRERNDLPTRHRPRFSLYLSSQLTYGIVVIYRRQMDMFFGNVSKYFLCVDVSEKKIQKPERGKKRKGKDELAARKRPVLDGDEPPEPAALIMAHMVQDISTITMREEVPRPTLPEEVFGEDFGPIPPEFLEGGNLMGIMIAMEEQGVEGEAAPSAMETELRIVHDPSTSDTTGVTVSVIAPEVSGQQLELERSAPHEQLLQESVRLDITTAELPPKASTALSPKASVAISPPRRASVEEQRPSVPMEVDGQPGPPVETMEVMVQQEQVLAEPTEVAGQPEPPVESVEVVAPQERVPTEPTEILGQPEPPVESVEVLAQQERVPAEPTEVVGQPEPPIESVEVVAQQEHVPAEPTEVAGQPELPIESVEVMAQQEHVPAEPTEVAGQPEPPIESVEVVAQQEHVPAEPTEVAGQPELPVESVEVMAQQEQVLAEPVPVADQLENQLVETLGLPQPPSDVPTVPEAALQPPHILMETDELQLPAAPDVPRHRRRKRSRRQMVDQVISIPMDDMRHNIEHYQDTMRVQYARDDVARVHQRRTVQDLFSTMATKRSHLINHSFPTMFQRNLHTDTEDTFSLNRRLLHVREDSEERRKEQDSLAGSKGSSPATSIRLSLSKAATSTRKGTPEHPGTPLDVQVLAEEIDVTPQRMATVPEVMLMDSREQQPLVVEEEEHVLQEEGAEPMEVAVAETETVADVAMSETVAEVATAETIADQAAAEIVADVAAAETIADQAAAETVADVAAAETVADVAAAETVADVAAAETVADVAAAETVADVAAAETVADVAAAETVADVAAAETVADVAAAETVADQAAAETVADVTAAETVADVAAAETVADVTAAETVADVTAAETVADVAAAETVADVAAAETVADVTAAETVADQAAAETVADQAAAETVADVGAREHQETEDAQLSVLSADSLLAALAALWEAGGGSTTFRQLCPPSATARRRAAKAFSILLNLSANKKLRLQQRNTRSYGDIFIYRTTIASPA